MTRTGDEARGRPIPSGRLNRLVRLGSMATGIGGEMVHQGVRQLMRGKRPGLQDMLLTPANAIRVTEQLARLRGAAMKTGQLLSMDAGDILSPELSHIMARLRADAEPMSPNQLD